MSVLIKDMEMPTSCWRCPLCLTIDPDTYRCIPTGQEFESTFKAIDHIVCDCPLVQIPSHGDLIDRDEQIERAWRLNLSTRELIDTMLKSAPTIIEAEE